MKPEVLKKLSKDNHRARETESGLASLTLVPYHTVPLKDDSSQSGNCFKPKPTLRIAFFPGQRRAKARHLES